MARFLPCPGCGRHVRSSDQQCPFCHYVHPGGGPVVQTTPGIPGRVSALLLGLCLVGCAGGKTEGESGKSEQPSKSDGGKTTSDAPGDVVVDSADGGASAGEDPRPAEKYGAPPPPDDGMIEPQPEPQPSVKYGAPPVKDDGPKPIDDAATKP